MSDNPLRDIERPTSPAFVPNICPTCGQHLPLDRKGRDGRENLWRCRVRLYGPINPDEPVYDSDPDLPPGEAGTLGIRGLPNVASELAQIALEYHGSQCQGLGTEILLHKLKSLRPTLSRRGGNAVWRVKYKIFVREEIFTGDSREQDWLARVDIQRENET